MFRLPPLQGGEGARCAPRAGRVLVWVCTCRRGAVLRCAPSVHPSLSGSLDPDQKEELVTVIEKLLADRTTLVVGSAVMAFEEVSDVSPVGLGDNGHILT